MSFKNFQSQTPGILSSTEFRAFWVKVRGNPLDNTFTISVGKGGDEEPFMSKTWDRLSFYYRPPASKDFSEYTWNQITNIQEVGFASWNGHSADWKIGLSDTNLQFSTPSYLWHFYDKSTVVVGRNIGRYMTQRNDQNR